MFIGRSREIARLDDVLGQVGRSKHGEFVGLRGRRQVGKSTLVEEFISRAGVPALFLAASQGSSPDRELAEFVRIGRSSSDPFATAFDSVTPTDWSGALRLIGEAATEPCIVVLDELPWLAARDPGLEGALQTAWDRHLSKSPVLLVVLGSDLSMMEHLGEYGRPLYQRMREMVLAPLTVADTADMLGVAPADAFDAQLVSGGLPRILRDWAGQDPMAFVADQLTESTSPLVVVGERVLAAKFPPTTQARDVLTAIGSGETTFANLSRRTGINQGSLSRTLNTLVTDIRVVDARHPLSAATSRLTQYTVDDLYLRFWLRFIAPQRELIQRGRGDVAARAIAGQWAEYRGRAVEPLVRRSIEQLLPDDRFGAALHVGSFWTRTGDVEVDLVGSPSPTAPAEVAFVGSVKWRENAAFDRGDVHALAARRSRVPGGEEAPLVAVARNKITGDADVPLVATDLLAAWR